MKKVILAISGGVDSVVMLDFAIGFFTAKFGVDFTTKNLIVTHFEHGIRGEESVRDWKFVENLAREKGLKFEFARGNLGENASEQTAREARYSFLRHLAERYNAEIWTAHHLDDLVETLAINFVRGTGWRGLACLNAQGVERPLLSFEKSEILALAKAKNLQWCEDSTNQDLRYFRNRLRADFARRDLPKNKKLELYDLRQKQIEIAREIDQIVGEILAKFDGEKWPKKVFRQLPDCVVGELLRRILLEKFGLVLTIRRQKLLIQQIKTFNSGQQTQISGGIVVRFSKTNFWFEKPPEKC